MTQKISCAKCDSNNLVYPLKMADDAVIHCGDCGARIGTVTDVTEWVSGQIAGRYRGRRRKT